MSEYYPFLSIMNYRESYTESYLIKHSSRKLVHKALEKNLIRLVDTTDVDMPRYKITQKGIDYCQSGENVKQA